MRAGPHTAGLLFSLLRHSHSLVRPSFLTLPSLSNVLGCLSGVLLPTRHPISPLMQCSYLIILKSLIPTVIASLYHDLTSPDTNPPDWALSGRIWLTLLMAILVPLSFLRRLDSLRHTSYIALFSCGECLLAHKMMSRAECLARLQHTLS